MKEKILIDVKIICDEPRYYGYHKSNEARAKYLESWVKEFHEFIRDHRSQDPVYLEIEKIYQDQCSFCESEWEVDETGCPVCCDEAVAEWKTNQSPVPARDIAPGAQAPGMLDGGTG